MDLVLLYNERSVFVLNADMSEEKLCNDRFTRRRSNFDDRFQQFLTLYTTCDAVIHQYYYTNLIGILLKLKNLNS